MLVVMSRGPTGRVRRLPATGAVPGQLLWAAGHEADLLGHPYGSRRIAGGRYWDRGARA